MAIGPSILEQEDALKNLPTEALQQMMRQPSPNAPPFLVAAELKRREQMAKEFAGKQAEAQTAQNAPTVAHRLAGMQQPMPMSQAGAMAAPPRQPPMPQEAQLAMAMSGATGQPPPQLPTVNAATGTSGAAVQELVRAMRRGGTRTASQMPGHLPFSSRERPAPVLSDGGLAALIAAILKEQSEPDRAYGGFDISKEVKLPRGRGGARAPARPVTAANGTQGRTVYAQTGLFPLTEEQRRQALVLGVNPNVYAQQLKSEAEKAEAAAAGESFFGGLVDRVGGWFSGGDEDAIVAGGTPFDDAPRHPVSGERLPAGAEIFSRISGRPIIDSADGSPDAVPETRYQSPYTELIKSRQDEIAAAERDDDQAAIADRVRRHGGGIEALNRARISGQLTPPGAEAPSPTELASFARISIEDFNAMAPGHRRELARHLMRQRVDTPFAVAQAEAGRKAVLTSAAEGETYDQPGWLERAYDYGFTSRPEIEARDAEARQSEERRLRYLAARGAEDTDETDAATERVPDDVTAQALAGVRPLSVGAGGRTDDDQQVKVTSTEGDGTTVTSVDEWPQRYSETDGTSRRAEDDEFARTTAALRGRLPALEGEELPDATGQANEFFKTLTDANKKIYADLETGLGKLGEADAKDFEKLEARFKALDDFHETGKLPERMRKDRITNLMLEMSKGLLGNQDLYSGFKAGIEGFQAVDKASRDEYAKGLVARLTASKGIIDSKMAMRNARRQESIAMTKFAAAENRGNAALAMEQLKIAQQARQNARTHEINLIRGEAGLLQADAAMAAAMKPGETERLLESLPRTMYAGALAKAKAGDRTELDKFYYRDSQGRVHPNIPAFMSEVSRLKSTGYGGARLASDFDTKKRQFQSDVATSMKALGGSWSPETAAQWGAIFRSIGLTPPDGPLPFNEARKALGTRLEEAAKSYYAAQIARERRYATPGMNEWIASTYGAAGAAQEGAPTVSLEELTTLKPKS